MKPSEFDADALAKIRQSVDEHIMAAAISFDLSGHLVLDVAPQVYEGAKKYFKRANIETLDIDPDLKATWIKDLCESYFAMNPPFEERYNTIICTEVLEHVSKPWLAVENMWWMLKPGGKLFVTTPFNFRIHGPLPDNWRFTEHGLRALFNNQDWEIESLEAVETPDRPLMPIHYRLIARKL